MHAQFFDKKGTNGQACTTHLTHTHASSSLLLLRRTGRCSPASDTSYFTPFSTLIFATLSHSSDPVEDTLASAFLCVLCMLSACIVFVCEEVSADLRFQCPILRHVSTLEVLCQAVAQPILRCRNFQATTLHSETCQSNFSNKIHLVNVKVILSKKFHPVGFADMMQVKPTVLATFVQHLFRRLACNGTTNLTFFHHHSASNI